MNLKLELERQLQCGFAGVGEPDTPALVTPAGRPEFGDYQANGVMALAKRLGTNPRDLAAKVVANLELDDIASDVSIAGPGFINVTFSRSFLAEKLANEPVTTPTPDPQRVVVDYSSPNLAKEMHVGHLRSTVIGDAIARTVAFAGHHVIRQNHVGDWGTQFGRLMAYLADQDKANAPDDLGDLEQTYVAASRRYEQDEAFAVRARQAVVDLQGGDAKMRNYWRQFIDVSTSHMQDIYKQFDISLRPEDCRGESAYNEKLVVVLSTLAEAGLLQESDGAQCVFLDEFKSKDQSPLPMIVQKSDGGFLYTTTDLATIQYRMTELQADRVLYFTDARQNLHFQMLFAVAHRAGYVPEYRVLEHHAFGQMLDQSGKPFQTREGGSIRLQALLDEGVKRAAEIIRSKNPELSTEEQRDISHAVAVGAIKYADLSKSMTHDYRFDWNTMLSFDGNTAPYLQYAYARIQSLFDRANVDPATCDDIAMLSTPTEHVLAVQLLRFQEVLESVIDEVRPHLMCAFLYDLTVCFTRFYEACPVLSGGNQRAGRLALCARTAQTLEAGFACLGIRPIARM